MSHVLIINPNTRRELTDTLLAQVHTHGLAAERLKGATAPFGADYIVSEQAYVVAAHAVLDAWHQHVLRHGLPRAVLVACFGDPGVWALREVSGVPVIGLAEAALREADALGPFGIVTGGRAWEPMLERLARGLQLFGPGRLRWIETVEASGGALAAEPEAGIAALSQACQHVMTRDAQYLAQLDADTVQGRAMRPMASLILGGAALGGRATQLSPQPSCLLIDSVAAGARWLQAFA